MNLDLQGKRILLTGGTKGIGLSILENLLKEGACVHFCARTLQPINQLHKKYGKACKGSVVDVTDSVALKTWVLHASQELGGIDSIISNASAMVSGSSIDAWQKAIDTDLFAALTLVDSSLPFLKKSKSASILFILSAASREVNNFSGAYGALKIALSYYAKTLSYQLAPDQIRVNCISPGNIYFKDGIWGNIEKNNPEIFSKFLNKNPLGRMGTPEEVANAALFLTSKAASFITGANLIVDGGLTTAVQN